MEGYNISVIWLCCDGVKGLDKKMLTFCSCNIPCPPPPLPQPPSLLLAIIFCSAVSLFWAIISHSIRPTAHDLISSSQDPCMWSWAATFSWSKPHHSPLLQLPNLHLSALVEKAFEKRKKKEKKKEIRKILAALLFSERNRGQERKSN